jgi:hypothetical protein
MSANKAPALTLPSDIQVYRIDNAEPINKKGPRGFIERYIHASLYARFKCVTSLCLNKGGAESLP